MDKIDKKDIVIFSAHPDDAEFGMGGTILKLTKNGKKVINIVFTKGDKGTYGTVEDREKELEQAAKVGGYDFLFLDHKDCEVQYSIKSRNEIAYLIRKYQPSIVMAPYHKNKFGHRDGSAHVDHIEVGRIVKDAVKIARLTNALKDSLPAHNINKLIYFMVPRNKVPSFIVDISEFEEELKKLFSSFKSQMQIKRGDNEIFDALFAGRRVNGMYCHSKYAEGFLVDDPIVLKNINDEIFGG